MDVQDGHAPSRSKSSHGKEIFPLDTNWKKDLKTHQVIDLLPDRTTETAAAWMGAHPEIELVSRDRGGDYAAAARKSVPQATQIADRFHLYQNLTEAVELALTRVERQSDNKRRKLHVEKSRKKHVKHS